MNYELSPWLICTVFSVTGGILGAIFDLYRSIRYFSRPGRWLTACGDMLYWTMVTGVLFGLFSVVVNGELRFYFFLFLVLGLGIYYCWFSTSLLRVYRYLGRLLIATFKAVYRLISKVFATVFAPVTWLLGVLVVPLKWLWRPFAAMRKAIGNWMRPPAPPNE
ncbi:MAG: spore cortex biosynthesis protein YabQ [Bacillota bacterium]